MRAITAKAKRAQEGFTLIEIIVVVAILGILAAILIPTVTGLLSEGDEAAFNADVEAVGLAVQEFKLDLHKGPDGSNQWGQAVPNRQRLYPTEDGQVGDIELDPDTASGDTNGNLLVVTHVDGPQVGTAAVDAEITASLVWIGLLVNEPFASTTTSDQALTGLAAPADNEDGEYLPSFPPSAHADNSTVKAGASMTNGSYQYVLLENGTVVGVYKNGGNYFAGFNDVFP